VIGPNTAGAAFLGYALAASPGSRLFRN
jgi:hypothetical protein